MFDQIKQLFSPPVLAALRYALTALAPLFALAGFAVLTPDQVNEILAAVQQFGTAAASIAALLGILIPVLAGIWGSVSATIKSQIGRVKEIAKDPTLAGAEAQQAIISATSAIAQQPGQHSEDAKQTLIAATIAIPEVQTIITDKATAEAATSQSVVAAGGVMQKSHALS